MVIHVGLPHVGCRFESGNSYESNQINMRKKSIRAVSINTTAFSEENFTLVTTLSDEEIIKVITPIVEAERSGGEDYDNDALVYALEQAYPDRVIQMHSELDKIKI